MKRTYVLVLLILFAACGDSEGASTDPADAGTCAELVATGMIFVQEMLDDVADLSLEDVANLGADEEPEAFEKLRERNTAVDARGDELGCTDQELDAEFVRRAGELEAGGPFAELILDGLLNDPDLFGN